MQSSLFPHLGQLQRHISNEVSHTLHLVYSAKSSLIGYNYRLKKNKPKIINLKICLIFYGIPYKYQLEVEHHKGLNILVSNNNIIQLHSNGLK